MIDRRTGETVEIFDRQEENIKLLFLLFSCQKNKSPVLSVIVI